MVINCYRLVFVNPIRVLLRCTDFWSVEEEQCVCVRLQYTHIHTPGTVCQIPRFGYDRYEQNRTRISFHPLRQIAIIHQYFYAHLLQGNRL